MSAPRERHRGADPPPARSKPAAEVIDPAAADPVLAQQWPDPGREGPTSTRCAAGCTPGRRPRLLGASTAPNASLAYRLRDPHRRRWSSTLWRDEPGSALEAMLPLLDETASTGSSLFAGAHLVIAATGGGRPGGFGPEVQEEPTSVAISAPASCTHSSDDMRSVPFGRGSVMADALGNEAMWEAELSRLVRGARPRPLDPGQQRAGTPSARPHDAAYCRWRAAQVALRDGQGTVAARLLKRAATDAVQHVPRPGRSGPPRRVAADRPGPGERRPVRTCVATTGRGRWAAGPLPCSSAPGP